MAPDQLAFDRRERALRVHKVRVQRELPDVVQQCGPAQAVPISVRQSEIVGDQLGEFSYTFCVTARLSVVRAETGGKLDDRVGRDNRLGSDSFGTGFLHTSPDAPSARSAQGDVQALGGNAG